MAGAPVRTVMCAVAEAADSRSQGAPPTPARTVWRTAEATAEASAKRTSAFCGWTLKSTVPAGASISTMATG